jgi:hypothetical protein
MIRGRKKGEEKNVVINLAPQSGHRPCNTQAAIYKVTMIEEESAA